MQKKGKNIMLFLNSKAVAMSTNHTLNVNPNIDETITKDDPEGPAGELDYNDWSASCASVVGSNGITNEQTYATLIAGQLAGTEFTCVMDAVAPATADKAVPATGWAGANTASEFPKMSGTAMISEISLDFGTEGFGSMSVTLDGISDLS